MFAGQAAEVDHLPTGPADSGGSRSTALGAFERIVSPRRLLESHDVCGETGYAGTSRIWRPTPASSSFGASRHLRRSHAISRRGAQ